MQARSALPWKTVGGQKKARWGDGGWDVTDGLLDGQGVTWVLRGSVERAVGAVEVSGCPPSERV